MTRVLDLALALAALLLLSPVLMVISVLIRAEDRGPVFYRGLRVGLGGKPFRILKFRSMVIDAERIGGSSTSSDDPRITRVGKLLRRYKLDELPQFFNVFLGDMSLVGPRPEVQRYVDMYSAEEQKILTVRPGITDWASIWNSDEGAVLAGSTDPDRMYEEVVRPTKLKLQLLYVQTRSWRTDLRILFCTLRRLMDKDYTPPQLATYQKLVS